MAAKKSANRRSANRDPHSSLELSEQGSIYKRGPRRVKHGIADADKVARTGSMDEPVRNTPPAGAWNDTSAD
jgi:hypothetical protein